MTQYKCIKRLTTDNHKTVHEVGDIVELSDQDAASALKQKAVVEYVAPDVEPAQATSPSSAINAPLTTTTSKAASTVTTTSSTDAPAADKAGATS